MSNEYVYVAVDETGNLGKSLKGERYYTLVACVVNNRERFENATRRLGYNGEVKFYKHDHLREKVLKYAEPAVSSVYYASYHKTETILNAHEQSKQHLDMVCKIADEIVHDYCGSRKMTVEVDEKDGISEEKVYDAFVNNVCRINNIECNILDSEESYGLQTNDFFTGAVGYMVNRSEYAYVNLFYDKLVPVFVHSKNLKKQGEPASTHWQTTGHADIPFGTGKPPGIATGLMGSLRSSKKLDSPVVRLIDPSELGYINACERSDDNICYSKNLKKQGEPASAVRQTTGHADIPFGTGKPPGIATGPMGSLRPSTRLGSPVVRLGNPSHTSYKNNSERRRIFGRMRK